MDTASPEKLSDAPLVPPGRRWKRRLVNALALATLACGLTLAVNQLASSPETVSDEQTVDRVRALVADVPLDEAPIVATIEDVDGLAQQDGFYVGAANGDRVVVFATTGQAIIYRPSSDEVIKSGTTSVSASN